MTTTIETKRRPNTKVQLAEELSGLARSLCLKCWHPSNIDHELRQALNLCLPRLNAIGVIAHFASQGVTLRHFTPSGSPNAAVADRIVKGLHAAFEQNKLTPTSPTLDESGFHLVAKAIPAASSGVDPAGYCALVYPADSELNRIAREESDTFHANSTVGLIFQVLHHRTQIFSPFAAGIAELYWDQSLMPKQNGLRPPWERGSALKTASLSLDLRKSTFCMENALRPDEFAEWLDDLVQILTAVTHLHGGVFDKFTGDGALVHFLDIESRQIYGTDGLTAALDCAISMQRAVGIHLDRLRRMLHHNSRLLGAAVGIDQHETYWSVDRRNNPITVGAGVVGACRLGDTADAGVIRMTNGAYQELQKTRDLAEFVEVDFASKEYKAEMKVTAWELPFGSHPLVRQADETDRIVGEVHRKRSVA
jgi:class 3 adenylate cyclase